MWRITFTGISGNQKEKNFKTFNGAKKHYDKYKDKVHYWYNITLKEVVIKEIVISNPFNTLADKCEIFVNNWINKYYVEDCDDERGDKEFLRAEAEKEYYYSGGYEDNINI